MSNLIFKEDVYTYKELLSFYLSGKKYFLEGEVYDTTDGEICDISYIKERMSNKYINELLKPIDGHRINKNYEKEVLYSNYKNKTITKDDMYRLLIILGQNKITPNYNYEKGYIILNANMMPNKISDSDYGKFHKLLNFIHTNHNNRIAHENGKVIKKIDIAKFLGYASIKNLNEYLRKMKKIRLLDEQNFGGIKYLIINPSYAKKNMQIDNTIYKIFKEDLDKCLTEEQIYYLNMNDANVDIDSMIPLED